MIGLFSALTFLCLMSGCNSYSLHQSSLSRAKTSRTQLYSTPEPLSLEDIALRWKVTKYGQGYGSYNGIKWLDRSLEAQVITIQMSRAGGLGLDLHEYNKGKDNIGLMLVEGVAPGSNAEKCGKFEVGDALLSIASVPSVQGGPSFRKSLEGLNFEATVDVLNQFGPYDDVEVAVKRAVFVDRTRDEEVSSKVSIIALVAFTLLCTISRKQKLSLLLLQN